MKRRVFSEMKLAAPGMTRRILVEARDGADTVLVIELLRDGTRVGTRRLHRRDAEILGAALALTRANEAKAVLRETGSFPLRDGVLVCFGAVLDPRREQAVQIWLVGTAGSRKTIGKPSLFAGAELRALELGYEELVRDDELSATNVQNARNVEDTNR